MTLDELAVNIRSVMQAGGDDLQATRKQTAIALTQWWNRYATPYWEYRVAIDGWKTVWMRASRIIFVSHLVRQAGILDDPWFVAQSTKDLPEAVTHMVAKWLRENKKAHKVSGNPKDPETIKFAGPVFDWLQKETVVGDYIGIVTLNFMEIQAYAAKLKGEKDAYSNFVEKFGKRANIDN